MHISALHDSVWAALQARRNRLPHALLLSGQRGLGKFALGEAFVAGLLCEAPLPDGHACGQCLACRWREQGNHPDLRIIQPAALAEASAAATETGSEGESKAESSKKASQQITIEQIRSLEEFFNVGTHRGGLRVILLYPAEAMNRNTANALLKTLEEPADQTLFVLVSSEPVRLLPTIRSRCQVVPVPTPDKARALAWLNKAGIAEPETWLALAGGAPLLAAELGNQASHRGKGGDSPWLSLLVEQLAQPAKHGGKHAPDPLAAATKLDSLLREAKGRITLAQLVFWTQKWLCDLMLCHHHLPSRYYVREQATIQALARQAGAIPLLAFYRQLLRWRREAEQPLNARLFLETLFLDYLALFKR
jgi:DNA polymerase-3 subunit delta'